MASEIYIEFNNHGFWIPPAFIEILSEYICKAFENKGVNTFSQGLQEIYSDCNANRKGEKIGMVNILFDEYITNDSDKKALINLLDNTKTIIQAKGNELSIEALNNIERNKTDDYFKAPWQFPIRTQSLVETINIIQQLLHGTWHLNNYGVYFTGFPNAMSQAEI